MKSKSKFLKRLLSFVLVFLMSVYLVSNHQQNVAYSQTKILKAEEMLRRTELIEIQKIPLKEYNPLSDITPPVLDLSTLSVSQKTAVPGDTVTIRVKASDVGSGVDRVWFHINGENGGSSGKYTYTPDDKGYYKFNFTVNEFTQNGSWKPFAIEVYDKAGNVNNYYASGVDLSAANFEVVNPNADNTPPLVDLTTLSVSQKTAVPGDTVTIRVKASDVGSGVDRVWFHINGENGGSSGKYTYTPDDKGYYKFNFTVNESTQSGLWKAFAIEVYDKAGNVNNYYASGVDLSAANFEVVDTKIPENPIDAEVVTSNTTWNYKTVDRDVYVGPEAILTINGDIKVNGNIYVLGAVVSYGDLSAKEVYAHSFSYGKSSTVYQGSFNVRAGSHSVEKMVATNHPIPNIPIEIYSSNEVSSNGYLTVIEGATLPIGDLYVEDELIEYNYNGTFSLNNVYVGGKPSLTFKIVDVFGKPHIYEFSLNNPNAVSLQVLSGSNRYETAVKISQTMYKTADTAILVRGDEFPDALAASSLAYSLNAPILLTETDQLREVTHKELSRLGVKKVIILGGSLAIDKTVDASLKNEGISVERIAGSTRYQTATQVAENLKTIKGAPTTAILTSGISFADALSAGSFAAGNGYPILLTKGDILSLSNLNFLKKNNIKEVQVMGGTLVVSKEVEKQLTEAGITVKRISGSTRVVTSAKIARQVFPNANQAIVVNGWNFPDGLAAAPYAAKLNAPILLVSRDMLSAPIKDYLKDSSIKTINVIGGSLVISESVRKELLDAIN